MFGFKPLSSERESMTAVIRAVRRTFTAHQSDPTPSPFVVARRPFSRGARRNKTYMRPAT
jgi:hypothetical protein